MHESVKKYNNIVNSIKQELEGQKNIIFPKIIAVSKTFQLERIIPLIEYGHLDYGENKVQEALDKWSEIKKENPVKFIETFLFQYLNPKGVMVAIIVVSTYVELGENYVNHAIQVVLLAFLFSSTSITLWAFIGKFLRKFATNDKFIKYFNYVMSMLLLLSILTFYI